MNRSKRCKKTVLFQVPYVDPSTPAAVNVWVKNIAKAFAIANFKPTIQYLSKNRFSSFFLDGVQFFSMSFPFTSIMKTPKLRAVFLPVIQDYYLEKFGKYYSIIAPMGGVVSNEREARKNEAIQRNGARHLLPILEHPSVTNHKFNETTSNFRQIANGYDYLMPITTYLRDLFIEHGRTKPSLLNPIIVDTKAIQVSAFPTSQPIKNLVYSGNLGHEEEMHILLDMFVLVQKELPDMKLHVLGGGSTPRVTKNILQKYKEHYSKTKAFSNITFHGQISHSEVIQQYRMADAFVLPRPFREYSRAGFPTKLGEYLATGKPVITTGTGDIPIYLSDLQSAYLVMDSTASSFAEKTVQAITDSSAREIGLMGAKVAQDHFSIEASAKRIGSFLGEYYDEYFDNN
ncbi:MAG: glycosyltransferase [Candidatus Sabulitectum sp.]|nr:glycosyltransferase [Candidatus Sabulitectum sp.]